MIVVDAICEYPASMTTDKGLPGRCWCHLTSNIAGDDGRRELLEFAQRIGLKPSWRQHWDQWSFHFDLTSAMRLRAIKAGAVEMSGRDVFVKRFTTSAEAKAAGRPVFGVTAPPGSGRGCLDGGGRRVR